MIFDSLPMMFIALIAGHFLADYPLQGDFLSKAKNRANPIPGVPWYQAMGAHAFIHGAFVAFITGIWWLCLAEALLHAFIDDSKCEGEISFNQDQAFHIMCKLGWGIVAIIYYS
tara:strand:+ start:138 stop:479 length:342 start_codon:yes stop_codon:yes gene_type:complete